MTNETKDPKAAGSTVECVACGRTKLPRGRDGGMYAARGDCDDSCAGFYCQPLSGDLWPGETRESFGFACSTAKELEGLGPIYEAST